MHFLSRERFPHKNTSHNLDKLHKPKETIELRPEKLNTQYWEAIQMAEELIGKEASFGLLKKLDTPYERALETFPQKLRRQIKGVFSTDSNFYDDEQALKDKQNWEVYKQVVSTTTGNFKNRKNLDTPIEADYVNPRQWASVMIIDPEKIEEKYPLHANIENGFRLIKKLDFHDPALLHILMDAPLRTSLLKWIETFPPEKKLFLEIEILRLCLSQMFHS